MTYKNDLCFYSFPYKDTTITLHYCFAGNELDKGLKNTVLMVIALEMVTIRSIKPESILRQPKEVIQKIVEREVKEYLVSEQLQAV